MNFQKGIIRFIVLCSVTIFTSLACAKPEVVLKFKMFPGSDFNAKSSNVKGSAKLVGTKVIAENISVPISSLDTGMELRTKHMKEKYLEMNKFPEAKLIRGEGENGKGKGLFEIHGEKKEVAGDYKINGNELTADFTLKMSDFKIAKVKYLGIGVGDDVKVTVTVPITK